LPYLYLVVNAYCATADLPRSARAPLRSGAHLTLLRAMLIHPPPRVCSLEGRALLFCDNYCARQIPLGPRVVQGNAQILLSTSPFSYTSNIKRSDQAT